MSTVVTDFSCPVCGSVNDRATHPDPDRFPKAGDLTICMHCAFIGVFTRSDNATVVDGVRLPNAEEEARYKADSAIMFVQQMVIRDIRERNSAAN